jgi:hypothetical protein
MYKRSDPALDLNRLRNVEMFKMRQFQVISGKKLMVFTWARLFKHRYIFLRLKKAFLKHFKNTVHSID